MDALLTSFGGVAIAEIGDKTQLLTLALAARFRRPWPIAAGILAATLANHLLAAWLGVAAADVIGSDWLRWVAGVSFLAMAVWILIPDRLDADGAHPTAGRGPFLATLIAFFIAEIGDKTQIATTALAAHYGSMWLVLIGSTAGLALVNLGTLWLGTNAARRVPLAAIRLVAAGFFALLGGLALLGLGTA